MKPITLILHKLSGSQDSKYGTITYKLEIPDKYTYVDLAKHILFEGFLENMDGFINYLERDGEFVYDFFEDFDDSTVIKNLDTIIPPNMQLIFSPNYYNYPQDPYLTLNYVLIRKDMRNFRWRRYIQSRDMAGFSDLTKEVWSLMEYGTDMNIPLYEIELPIGIDIIVRWW